MRDTDADWRAIGAAFPFWGVLTAPEYRQAALSSEALAAFYATGREHMAETAERLARIAGAPFHVTRALDFGCGVGRLTEAMTGYADDVVGLDVSPGMLEEARRNSSGRVRYTDQLGDEPFDWINSYIVFQHIPPERGMVLLDQMLSRLAPRGFLSLQFTGYTEPHLRPPPPAPPPKRGLLRRPPSRAEEPVGAMHMYDYDIGAVLRMIHAHGVHELHLVHTNHGGHHGEMILGRRI